ncbi:MAG TPA: LysR substrate-binding domain-containing protein [Bacteroidia bacterium]|nr:LysR substrate-binding domain-containing protein [Bacteroidia bacterium]
MELRHLRYFIAVAEEENVTRAAARLHVAQPALSRQIRDLECELGVELFDHSMRSIHLNAAGRHFLAEAREAVARFEEAIRSVRDFADGQIGELHVGYAPSLSTSILPRALRGFQGECPRMRVKLHDLSTEEMLAGLRDRSLDAALLVRPSNPSLDGLVFEGIVRYRPCVAMPLSHPLATDPEVSVEAVAGEPFVAYGRASYPEYHAWFERIFKATKPPRIHAEYDSSTSLIASVESGCGLAIVQEGFESLAGTRLAIRKIRGADEVSFSFGVACRRGDASEATRRFVAAALATAPGGADE